MSDSLVECTDALHRAEVIRLESVCETVNFINMCGRGFVELINA